MRTGPLLAVFVLLAGCVDPEARTEPTPELPPAPPPERILVAPMFDLEDAEGRWQRNIMLGQEVFINATRTPTANLTEVRYILVEEDQVARSGTLWPGALRQAIRPSVEGTHAILVVSRSTTGQEDVAMIHLGVSVEESRSYDLAVAAPLSAPEACRPAESVLGQPAAAREDFAFFSAALPEAAVFSARAGDGVQLAWCHGQQPLESFGEDGWTRTLLPLNSVPRTVSLWIANTGAMGVEVDIKRHFPGSPMH